MQKGRLWTREELLVALALYISRPFGSLHSRNRDVAAIAGILHRTPGSVSRKLGNLGALDPNLSAKGLPNVSKADRAVWDEFMGPACRGQPLDVVFEAAQHVAETSFGADLSFLAETDTRGVPHTAETERTVMRKDRLSAGFFRAAVISNFDGRCAVTGLRTPELLEAAHILPWADHEELRLVPQNGLSLCTLIHRAYDSDLIGIDPNGCIHVSQRLRRESSESYFTTFFCNLEKRLIAGGRRFTPNPDFLSDRYAEYQAVQKNDAHGAKADSFLMEISA